MRALLSILLLLATVTVSAEWDLIGKNASGTEFYGDVTTLKRHGNYWQIWELKNLGTRDERGALSIRELVEYDCDGARYRTVSIVTNSGPMGTGKIITAGTNPLLRTDEAWSYPPPGSIGQHKINAICGK